MSRINDAMGESQHGAVDQLKDKAAEVTQSIRDIGGQVRDIGGQVREIGGQVRDTAKEKYDHLRGQAHDYYDQGRAKARQWEDTVEGYVHEKPVKALLIAAGVGLVLGMLWRRS